MTKNKVGWEKILDFVDSYCLCLTDGKHGLDEANRAGLEAELKETIAQELRGLRDEFIETAKEGKDDRSNMKGLLLYTRFLAKINQRLKEVE